MHSDTTRDAARLRLQVLRELGGPGRLKQALELSEAVRRLFKQGLLDRSSASAAGSGADAT